ncbi:hypothetical protein FFF34_002850 [Inquilinus sp. KBS0705]|nr:hypothetical protein FFF34_002850 [Inquilinus sp. KBS0705]
MKFQKVITCQVAMQLAEVEEKITDYLKKNKYRITDRAADYIIFTEDEFSDGNNSGSDYVTRPGEGKFEFHSVTDTETILKLIYLTSITYPVSIMIGISVYGIYTELLTPILLSPIFTIPIIVRVLLIKGNVFREVLNV